jgi:hypothetical protein
MIFMSIMGCVVGIVGSYQRFGGTYCLRLQEDGDSMFLWNEDQYQHLHRRENLKSQETEVFTPVKMWIMVFWVVMRVVL